MATVTYAKATRIYPGSTRPAVDALDLEIADGEFLVLVGPSGCGKSTSLRMLAGPGGDRLRRDLHRPDRRHQRSPEVPRHRDGLPELRALPPHDRVPEHGVRPEAAQDAQGRDRPSGQGRRRACSTWTRACSARKPKALSGGQRQRVAMGRAIVREPQVFLMDEPLSNLDAKLRVQTRAQIAALQQRLGVTTVYVTHDQVEAMTMGDRVAVLLDGVLQQVDGPRALYDRPANAFVAGFIGSPAMNLRTVRLTDSGADFGGLADPAHPGAGRGGPGRRRRRPGHDRLPAGAQRAGQRRRRAASRWWSSWSRSSAPTRTCTATPSSTATTARTRWSCVRTAGSCRGWARLVYLRPREGSQHVFHAATGVRI